MYSLNKKHQLSLFEDLQSDHQADNNNASYPIPEEIQSLLYSPECKILVAFSGGKDSVAMILYLLNLGIPKDRIEIHHHDVDGNKASVFDWPCTPSYCQAFADAMGIDVVYSWREGGIAREIYRENEGLQDVFYKNDGELIQLPSRQGNSTRRKFPAVAADLRTRWCSSVSKIDVLSRVVNHKYNDCDLLILTGERREESPARSKYKEFEKYRSWTKRRNAWQWRPIIDFSEKEVWQLFEQYSIQPHPCYELGWSRCSCMVCIFSSANTWASIFKIDPQRVNDLSDIEQDIGHTIYNGHVLFDRVEKGKSFLDQKTLDRWKVEALGKFNSPIIVDEWQFPKGAFSGEISGSV
jgi:3'-phosphoadenosine 5'-phosphosulfate sulfotransferase (PAPS reductase)/FAD synthetase